MENLTLKAYAKINLGLDVVRRLPNGYHEVKMVMQTVDIYDELTFTKKDSGICVTVEAEGLPAGAVPADENNLIYKAAKQLMDKYGVTEGVHIHLKKNIPVAAGMAGGSTDAAAAYRGVNALFNLGATEEEICEMAVKVGADVPYCVKGGTALSEGIGEVLTILPDAPECFVLVAKPDLFVSTKYVYENLHADTLKHHPDIDGMVEAIKEGNLNGVIERMENVLETVTEKTYPVIGEIKNFMEEKGARRAMMSGSGPTVFGIYDDGAKAVAGYEALKETGLVKQIFLTTLVNPKKEENADAR